MPVSGSRLFFVVVLCVMALTQVATANPRGEDQLQPDSAEQPTFVTGEVIVRWRSALAARTVARAIYRAGGRSVRRARQIADDTWVYQIDERSAAATLAALRELAAEAEVAEVELSFERSPFKTPNDQRYNMQWYIPSARIDRAWDRTTGNPQLVVAVVDTGILADHPDLAGRTLAGRDFVSDPASAGDGNGWDADPRDAGSDALSSSGFHGTHVAGIVGAAVNNKIGIAGISQAKLLPVRALGVNKGVGNDADISAAIRWAAGLHIDGVPDNPTPAHVINLSFGGPGYNATLDRAVQDAIARGSIVVAAAGNQSSDVATIYPAALKGVITVGATTIDGKRAFYSNYGKEVELMAPGGDLMGKLNHLPPCANGAACPAGILSTLFDSTAKQFSYQFYEGTSQAAPIVSGVVSLMLSVKPSLNTYQVNNILTTTAETFAQCSEGCGAGLLNAEAALEMAVTGRGPAGSGSGGNTVEGVGCSLLRGAGGGAGVMAPLALVAVLLLLAVVNPHHRRAAARALGARLDGHRPRELAVAALDPDRVLAGGDLKPERRPEP
jgi:serine protease